MKSRPFTRYADRCNPFIRQWRLLVLLRRSSWTLAELAAELGCVERTVRRDIDALQAVPFPIRKRGNGAGDEPGIWYLGEFTGWPRQEVSPVEELSA